MNEPVPRIPDLILLAIPVFILSIAAEVAYLAHRRKEQRDEARLQGYSLKDSAASISMGLGNVAVNLVWKALAFGLYTALYQLTPLRLGFGALAWVAVLFADDFAYYWFHRVHHESRLFWASHVIHHSSQRYNLSTAVRQTWTPFTAFVFWAPLALLGFHPVLIVTANSISLLYQFFIHTERIDKLWRPVELVMNTPSHHRVHHGANQQYLDKNYGGILIVWDKLFGSFEPELRRIKYGLTKNIRTHNPFHVGYHEFIAIATDVGRSRRLRDRLGYVLRHPGWTPAEPQQLAA